MGWSGYPYWSWRYGWSPWLPWWIGQYRRISPYMRPPKEQEIAMLEAQRKLFKEAPEQIEKRLEELKEEE